MGLDHCLLAESEAQMTAPEGGERLTPPLTIRDLLSTSVEAEQRCHVMHPEIRNTKARHMWA